MSLLWPAMLLTLLILPLCVALYLRVEGRRRQLAARYGSLGQAWGMTGQGPGARRHIPAALYLAALALLCVAMARPQATVSLPRLEGTIMLVFDVSGSMAADDVGPTRLDAAKAAAVSLVERRAPGVRVGVVAFSDGGLAVQVPTSGQDEILGAIERLEPQRGTSLGEGILAALNTIATDAAEDTPEGEPAPLARYPSAAIVLLSDGENTAPPDPIEVAQTAASLGVRIYTVGVGTTEGATLHIEDFSVHSRLDEAALQQIAEQSGGAYFGAGATEGLTAAYEQLSARLTVRPEATEITSLFVGAGLLLLLVGGVASLLWFNRLA
jgi:Ca-activated chloride channel family protein